MSRPLTGKQQTALPALGRLLDDIDAQTKLPDEPSLRKVVADHARDQLGQRLCPDCNGSGYASTIDGRTVGTCQTCDGWGVPPCSKEHR